MSARAPRAPSDAAWIVVRFDADAEAAERWSDALLEAGALSVDLSDPQSGSAAETPVYGEPGEPSSTWPLARVDAMFDAGHDVDAALRAIAPGAAVTMPDTGRADVKRISVVGPQTFNIKADANAAPAPQNVPGWSDAFIVTAPQHVAIIIFRTSDANDADKSFREAVDAAARTIQVAAAAPAAPAGGAAGGAAQPMPMGP